MGLPFSQLCLRFPELGYSLSTAKGYDVLIGGSPGSNCDIFLSKDDCCQIINFYIWIIISMKWNGLLGLTACVLAGESIMTPGPQRQIKPPLRTAGPSHTAQRLGDHVPFSGSQCNASESAYFEYLSKKGRGGGSPEIPNYKVSKIWVNRGGLKPEILLHFWDFTDEIMYKPRQDCSK